MQFQVERMPHASFSVPTDFILFRPRTMSRSPQMPSANVVPLLFVSCCLAILSHAHAQDESTAAALLNATAVEREVENLLKEGDLVYEEGHDTFFPLQPSDYFGFLCCLVGLVLAAGGGIGGGGILIPIYILVMGFSPKHAIPLSNVTVLGGAIANIALNTRQRHPDPDVDRPLIDWLLILVMEPVTIAGAVVGTWLNSMLNETVIVIMLIVLLAFTARKTLTKAVNMYQQESRELREEAKLASNAELTPLVTEKEALPDDRTDGVKAELAKIIEEERTTPIGAVAAVVALFLVVFAINLAKGGGAFESPLGIECGSIGFWLSNVLILVAVALCTVLVRSWLVRRFEMKQRVNYQYAEGDIEWDARATMVYPALCGIAGLFAGMFGIGGGIVKGPLMISMGVHPAVASATSATMILFTSLTATTSYVVFGLLPLPEYAVACLCFGFVATLCGQILLSFLIKLHARNSYIAFCIGAVVLISALLMTVQSIISIASGEKHDSGGICGMDN